jgi:hypothetical protein
MQSDKMTHEDGLANTAAAVEQRVIAIDPSVAVTGMGSLFGIVGALIGIALSVYLAPSFSLALVGYCLVAAFAGGSAGIVTGGLVGAIFAVMRGVVAPPDGRVDDKIAGGNHDRRVGQ